MPKTPPKAKDNHETHYACDDSVKVAGGETMCCECSGHKCKNKCTCNMNGAESDIGHKLDCPFANDKGELPKAAWEEEFDKNFSCIQNGCDGNGHIQISENESEQCQFHAKYIFPLKSFIRQTLADERERIVKKLEEAYHLADYESLTSEEFTTYLRGLSDAIEIVRNV